MSLHSTEDSAFFRNVEKLITEREALRSVLLAAVIAEIVGASDEATAMAFCNGRDLPPNLDLMPWADTAITVLGMRGAEKLQ
jgi:hypothetical protein